MNSMWGPLASRYTIGAKNIIANLQVIVMSEESIHGQMGATAGGYALL